MKNVKNDTKYIIKRILIGVGIAIILFNLKKCNVYADTQNQLYIYNSLSRATGEVNYISTSSASSFYLSGTGTIYLGSNTYNTNTNIEDLNGNNYNVNLGYERNEDSYAYHYYAILKSDTLNTYAILNLGSNNATNYNALNNGGYINIKIKNNATYYVTQILDNNKNYVANLSGISGWNILFTSSSDRSDFISEYGLSSFGAVNNTNGAFYNFSTRLSGLNVNTSDDSFLYNYIKDNNFYYYGGNVPVLLDGEELVNDPLASLTKVDLTGYQAVLLVPKNYQTMLSNSSHTNESPPGTFRTYLDLEYYSQECVRGTLINIENVKDIMLNNIGVGTGNLSESITGTCYSEPTQTIMSYEYDQYSGLRPRGLLIYNGAYEWQSGFSEDTSFFGTSYVWYDSTMYNSYLVESFDNFNQTIQYKDYSGEDQEVTIESLPTFTESMENSIDNVDSPTPTEVNRQKLQAIFNFLKTPFTFINKLNTTSCSAIVFPLPFVNRNLTLECMSTAVYNRYLPTILKTFIITILNGLIFYRCTLNNIDIFTNILDPEDNKLEAIDL